MEPTVSFAMANTESAAGNFKDLKPPAESGEKISFPLCDPTEPHIFVSNLA